jgi:hypothetical protein
LRIKAEYTHKFQEFADPTLEATSVAKRLCEVLHMEEQIKTEDQNSNESSDTPNPSESASSDSVVTAPLPQNPDTTQAPQDSGETSINKAEAAPSSTPWKIDLQTFESKMNGLLATKENMRLVAINEKIHSAYALSWTRDSNHYFRLLSNLRRRLNDVTVGGKHVA